jgi:hypothetical protein
MIIDCHQCEMYQSVHCADCFVTAILSKKDGPVVLQAEEENAVRHLQQAGLAPALKFKRKAG